MFNFEGHVKKKQEEMEAEKTRLHALQVQRNGIAETLAKSLVSYKNNNEIGIDVQLRDNLVMLASLGVDKRLNITVEDGGTYKWRKHPPGGFSSPISLEGSCYGEEDVMNKILEWIDSLE